MKKHLTKTNLQYIVFLFFIILGIVFRNWGGGLLAGIGITMLILTLIGRRQAEKAAEALTKKINDARYQ